MRLLIIEDDVNILNCLKKELMQNGLCIDVANNGIEGEEKAFVNDYDLILLDLSLPDKTGMDILKYLRSEGIDTPIIVITGNNSPHNISNILNYGADDYIVKPFEYEVLEARINAVIRRFNGKVNPIIEVNNIQINFITRNAFINNKKIDLTTKEFDILEYLAIKYPAVISSQEILEHVYDEHFDPFSSVLRVHIAKLRKKLRKYSGVEVLFTIRGKGYSLYKWYILFNSTLT